MICPVCKADNNVGAPVCRRCKVDLSLLNALEQKRSAELNRAAVCLQRGELNALVTAEEAHRLRRDDESRKMLALARLLCGDFAGAWSLRNY